MELNTHRPKLTYRLNALESGYNGRGGDHVVHPHLWQYPENYNTAALIVIQRVTHGKCAAILSPPSCLPLMSVICCSAWPAPRSLVPFQKMSVKWCKGHRYPANYRAPLCRWPDFNPRIVKWNVWDHFPHMMEALKGEPILSRKLVFC